MSKSDFFTILIYYKVYHYTYVGRLGAATYCTVMALILLSPQFRCDFVLGTWWALQNLMKQAKFVAYEQKVIVYIFCWILLWVLLQAPTTRLAAPLHQNKLLCQKLIHNHILFICYKLCLFHQILKCSSCFLKNLTAIPWL